MAASSKYHVKEISPIFSFIVCVNEEASSNCYRLKKIRLKAAAHVFIVSYLIELIVTIRILLSILTPF